MPHTKGPSEPRTSTPPPNDYRKHVNTDRHRIVDEICEETNLYKILGVDKDASNDELRRAYITRSRLCHPDKFPEYPKATEAFQKLSLSYDTLNKSSTRRIYDHSGKSNLGGGGSGKETLNEVLYQLFLEFMDGDFETIRALLAMLSENNPSFNLGEESAENLYKTFLQMRDTFLAGQKYLNVVQFELIRLYELQYQLRSLSYFDVFGRLKLTMQMARLTLTIPLHINSEMKKEPQIGIKDTQSTTGLIGENLVTLIGSLVLLLESGERYI